MKTIELESITIGCDAVYLSDADHAPQGDLQNPKISQVRGGNKRQQQRRFVRETDLDKIVKVLVANALPPMEIKVCLDGSVIFMTGSGVGGGDSVLIGELNNANDDAQAEFDAWRQRHEA